MMVFYAYTCTKCKYHFASFQENNSAGFASVALRDRFRVHAPKTEHHLDGGERWVPIFPELRPYLNAAFDHAPDGAVHIISRYRDTNANLRSQLCRIVRNASLIPWPKLFVNCRASRETELAEQFPIQVMTQPMAPKAN
jgi:hypothetical protein